MTPLHRDCFEACLSHCYNVYDHVTFVTDQMITNGDVEMQARQEEIRFLQMQLAEENRNIDLLRKNLPSKTALEQEMVTLQIQVSHIVLG